MEARGGGGVGVEKCGSVITVTTSAQRSSGEWALCVSAYECICVCVFGALGTRRRSVSV